MHVHENIILLMAEMLGCMHAWLIKKRKREGGRMLVCTYTREDVGRIRFTML